VPGNRRRYLARLGSDRAVWGTAWALTVATGVMGILAPGNFVLPVDGVAFLALAATVTGLRRRFRQRGERSPMRVSLNGAVWGVAWALTLAIVIETALVPVKHGAFAAGIEFLPLGMALWITDLRRQLRQRRDRKALQKWRATAAYHDELMTEVKALAEAGQRMEAISLYKDTTGNSLIESIDFVHTLLGIRHDPAALLEREKIITSHPDIRADVIALAADGKKIQAIKRYRELTGYGLKESKDVIDRL
jgi:ribosomal protein L7/L12